MNTNEKPSPETINFWESLTEKKNWRIVELANGYFQTELLRSTGQWVDVTRRATIEDHRRRNRGRRNEA